MQNVSFKAGDTIIVEGDDGDTAFFIVSGSVEVIIGQGANARAVDTLQTGEAVAIQGVEGAAAPMKVVESVMAAQRSLQTVLAIRDKAVAAYQEIARMTI